MHTVRIRHLTILSLSLITFCLGALFTTSSAWATGNTPFASAAQALTAPLRQLPENTPTTEVTTVTQRGRKVSFITGVNTAGTVRVNNLANLEALLNIVANSGEVAGIIGGGWLMVSSFLSFRSASQTDIEHLSDDRPKALKRAGKGMVVGITLVLLGMALPGTINWLVASARDANLCN